MSINKLIDKQPTNEKLITITVANLKNDNKTDTSLLNILSDHIFKLNPKSTAVSDAVKEIEALAEKRVEGAKGDHANYD